MVVGNGMIAKRFEAYRNNDEFLIFASGVSDSAHPAAHAFEREKNLLTSAIDQHPGKTLVYFSTCSIYDPSMKGSAYVQHKLNMENLITQKCDRYVIFRLSNPVGKTSNPHTVVNYFVDHILNRRKFDAWSRAARNIIDMDHVYLLCHEILQEELFLNATINIANPHNYPVVFMIGTIEKHFDIKANYTLLDKGGSPDIDISAIESLFRKFSINFGPDYLPSLLQKYFPVK